MRPRPDNIQDGWVTPAIWLPMGIVHHWPAEEIIIKGGRI
jgi:hypothetical protein